MVDLEIYRGGFRVRQQGGVNAISSMNNILTDKFMVSLKKFEIGAWRFFFSLETVFSLVASFSLFPIGLLLILLVSLLVCTLTTITS